MNQLCTSAIVLSRVDYGEADRILTVLTPDSGKLSLMAKGVRRIKSKLAGGIELFSISEITYIPGRGSVSTLVSSRLVKHYGRIVADIGRTMTGYECIKLLHTCTEDEPEAAYFNLLEGAFLALDDKNVSVAIIQAWFDAQLLKLAGHMPNLHTTREGDVLATGQCYEFDFDAMAFQCRTDGSFSGREIKLLRLLFSPTPPIRLSQVGGVAVALDLSAPLVRQVRRLYLRG